MRTLVLMRHATAGTGPAGSDDSARMISPHGHREAEQAGVWLRAHSWGPGPERTVLASTAVRARETAEHLGGALQLDRWLYNAGEDTLLEAIRCVDADLDTVVLVAHNPGIHRLAWWLAQNAEATVGHAGNAAVARDGHAELRQVIRPTTR
jgi:phosphohistidine phosphatase